MGKTKKDKRVNSDAFNAKKTTIKSKKINPFEVHLDREKFTILGRKCKHDRGLPGVSRAKAIKRRKQTLGKEFKDLQKVNKFKDGRMGADTAFGDELAEARFVTEKMKQFKSTKKDLFNLDDEILTHRGQTLQEIEQFQNPASDESEDEELDAQFTEAAHFGGHGDGTDRETAIAEMIVESKRKKIEAAKEKEEIHELTVKLDQNYKDLIPLIGKLKNERAQKGPRDDYDRVLKEMVFAPRGEVTDKLKTEDQLMRESKAKLEKLENERLARMREEEQTGAKPKHKSADDLDDGYFAGDIEEEDEATLAYTLNDDVNEQPDSSGDEEGEASQHNKAQTEENEEEREDEEKEDSMSNMSEDDEESDDGLSDLKSSESESEEEPLDSRKKAPKSKNEEQIEKKCKQKDLKVKAINELPYTFEIPITYEEFSELLEQYPGHQGVVVERIIKCNNPKLDPSNKDKMVKLFGFLLQYVNDRFSKPTEETIEKSFRILDSLVPHIYDLSHMNPGKTSSCLLEVIKEKYEDFRKNSKTFPSVDLVIFFKLVSLLYSTSDFRHSIVTPSYIFLSHILSRAQAKNRRDVSVGFFLLNIVLECTQLSKRFLPGALNFLRGVIFLCVSKKPIEIINVIPPFQSTGSDNNLLVVDSKAEIPHEVEDKLLARDLVVSTYDESFKVRALSAALKLLIEYVDVLGDNVGASYLVHPFLELLEKLIVDKYPEFVKQNYNRAKASIHQVLNKPMHRLVAKQKRPKALKLMEPRIEKVYDDKRRPKLSKEKEERAIMVHKIKRETKGAVREIRRDTAFLSKLQIKKQIQSDLERKEKVQRIYSEAANQQGELNALSRKRKKM